MTHRKRPLSPELHLRIYLWFLSGIIINKYLMRINEITPPDDQPIRLKLRGFTKSPDGKQAPSPAAKWVDEIYAVMPKNPLNPDQLVMLFGEGNNQQIAMFELEPMKTDPDTVHIKWFQAYPQKQGVGRRAMQELQDMARKAGLKLNLTSWKLGKVPERVLNKFYKSMGFKSGASGMVGLTWDPKEPVRENEDDKQIKLKSELFRNVSNSFNEGNPYDAIEWIEDSDFTINDIPALKAMFDANLNQIAKLVIDEMRYGQVDNHVFERIREMLENIGMEMPNAKLADLLYDSAHRIENGLRKMAIEGEYAEMVAVIYELNHWGLGLSFEDIVDVEEEKDDIIKSMLQSMKKGNARSVRFMVQQLRDDGIDWPELEAFDKSLAALREARAYDPETFDDAKIVSYQGNRLSRRSMRDVDDKRDDKRNKADRSKPLKMMEPTDAPTVKFPKIDPEDDGIRAHPIYKPIGRLGAFMMTGHFRDRIRQRHIDQQSVIDLIDKKFKNNLQQIMSIPYYEKILLKDTVTELGLLMIKRPMRMPDGKQGTQFTFVTAHPLFHLYRDRYVVREMDASQLDKPTPTIEDLATKYNVSAHDVLRELAKGVTVEQEHTTRLDVAREIALDHLAEDLYYYAKLSKMEKPNA